MNCEGTALVKAYSDFVIRGLRLETQTHYFRPEPLREVVITYMARRSTPQWPERKYCNDTDSFFKCHYWSNFGERALGRMIVNENALIARMEGFAKEKRDDGKRVVVKIADFNKLSFREQIAVDIATDIMVKLSYCDSFVSSCRRLDRPSWRWADPFYVLAGPGRSRGTLC